jgi:hypothetical protein
MGLLIKLQNGDTLLKSLKFGHDRPGGGDSNQPYIKKPINKPDTPALNNDFLLRGGISAPFNAAEDVIRLSKFFFDYKSPLGILFTAKQNLLSRIAVKAEVAETRPGNIPGPAYGGGTINEGIYTPLSTLAEAGIVAFGGHLNKQGLDPTGLIPGYAIKKYGPTSFVLNEPRYNEFRRSSPPVKTFTNNFTGFTPNFSSLTTPIELSFSNRLLRFWYTKELPEINFDPNLYSYSGGPNSILGIGKTDIKFGTLGDGETPLRTGVNNILFSNPDTRSEFLRGRMPSLYNSWFINYVDGVPKYEETLNVAKFIGASQRYGLLKNEIWVGDVEEDPGYLYSIGLDKYLGSVPYFSRSAEQRKEDSKWTFPVGASIQYNLFNKDVVNNQIARDKSFIQQKINDLEVQAAELDKKLNDPEQYTYQETTQTFLPDGRSIIRTQGQLRPKEEVDKVYSSYFQQWTNILREISNLKDQLNKPNDTDYANTLIKVVSLDNTNGLYKGDNSYKASIENNSVYKPGSLTKRQDIDSYNTFYQQEINNFSLNRETLVYDFTDKVTNNNINRIYYDSTADGKLKSKSLLKDLNDLVDFNFQIIDPTKPSDIAVLLDFRAYIDTFSDSYNNTWSEQSYMGRAEKQYRYNSFNRDISLGFTIVADNPEHLDEMYRQLNTLASSIAPKYTEQGYMAGMLHRLRVGNYIWYQWGILEGLTYEVTDNSPWEISTGNQLPMYIKVTGVKFKPIHNFRPEFITTTTFPKNSLGTNLAPLIENMPQKYIYQNHKPIPVETTNPQNNTQTVTQTNTNTQTNSGIQTNVQVERINPSGRYREEIEPFEATIIGTRRN